MKDYFKKIEQEDEARVRFKQRVVRRLLKADAINILVGVVQAMVKDKRALKDVQR